MLALYVTQFVSSEFSWDEAGILLAQSVGPIRSEDPSIHVKFEILAHEATSKEAVVHIRIPSWTTASHGSASLNGKQLQIPPPGKYLWFLKVKHILQYGDFKIDQWVSVVMSRA